MDEDEYDETPERVVRVTPAVQMNRADLAIVGLYLVEGFLEGANAAVQALGSYLQMHSRAIDERKAAKRFAKDVEHDIARVVL